MKKIGQMTTINWEIVFQRTYSYYKHKGFDKTYYKYKMMKFKTLKNLL